VDRSLENLEVESIDLLQLHCPPTEVYYRPEVFDALDDMVARNRIRHYGVSVEKVEEALKAIEYPGVETVQRVRSGDVRVAPAAGPRPRGVGEERRPGRSGQTDERQRDVEGGLVPQALAACRLRRGPCCRTKWVGQRKGSAPQPMREADSSSTRIGNSCDEAATVGDGTDEHPGKSHPSTDGPARRSR